MAGPFNEMHEYVERLMGEAIFTLQFADEGFTKELREKAKPDFYRALSGSRGGRWEAVRSELSKNENGNVRMLTQRVSGYTAPRVVRGIIRMNRIVFIIRSFMLGRGGRKGKK